MDHLNHISVASANAESQDISAQRCRSNKDDLKFAPLIHALKTPACYFNQDGEVLSINDAWRDYAGLFIDVAGKVQWIELIQAEHRYDALTKLRIALATSDYEQLACRLAASSNRGRWFSVNLHRVDVGWLCTCVDIDDMKSRERELESRATMQTDMLDVSVDCIKLIAPNGNILHLNRAGCRALGVSENSGFGMPWLPLLPEEVWDSGTAALESARNGVFSRFPGRSTLPGQGTQYWDNMLTPILNADGKTTAILCVSREVTRERESLNLLQRSEERLALAARLGGLGVWDYDIARDALQCDENWYRIFGCESHNPVSSIEQLRPMIHPDDVGIAMDVEKTAEDIVLSGPNSCVEYRIVRPDGEIRWLRSAAYLQHQEGLVKRAIGFVLDITDMRRSELALRDENRILGNERASFQRQSLEDPLTGIPNRRHLDLELERICHDRRHPTMRFCIILIDIDHFKQYNDMYGHADGDKALKLVATALKDSCRQSDFIARYGGEEFMVIARQIKNPVPLLDGFTKAIRQLDIPHDGTPTGRLTLSCGCAVSDVSGEDLSASWLIKQSDDALYEAKTQGRDRYIIRNIDS